VGGGAGAVVAAVMDEEGDEEEGEGPEDDVPLPRETRPPPRAVTGGGVVEPLPEAAGPRGRGGGAPEPVRVPAIWTVEALPGAFGASLFQGEVPALLAARADDPYEEEDTEPEAEAEEEEEEA